jgi:hypothetical protein
MVPRHHRRLAALASQVAAGSPALPAWSDHTLYPVRPDPRQTSHRSDPAAEAEATALLDRWMTAWNARDMAALAMGRRVIHTPLNIFYMENH